jgi:hypothetical protein
LARSRFKLEFATTPDAGIEVAGEMSDFLRESVRYYDRIDLQDIGVTVLEHGSRILPPMQEALVGVRRMKDDDAGGSPRHHWKERSGGEAMNKPVLPRNAVVPGMRRT